MAMALVCVTGMVAIGYRSNTVPYVVALDDVAGSSGHPGEAGRGQGCASAGSVVARWVTNLRT